MRVPRPPARTTAAGFGRLIPRRVLGRQDSNLGSRDQNPLPYHLATPQSQNDQFATVQLRREKRSTSATAARIATTISAIDQKMSRKIGTSMTSTCETAAI